MEITRNVILDLLPLYLADEVNSDTRTLVEEYLKNDPELANIAQHLAKTELLGDIPVPLTKENEMEAYKKANQLMVIRTLGLAAIIATTVLLCTIMLVAPVLVMFFLQS